MELAILENMNCGVCVRDEEQGILLYSNECFNRFFEKSMGDGSIAELFQKYRLEGDGSCRGEYFSQRENLWFDLSVKKIGWEDGRRVLLYTVYDMTEIKRYQQRVERQANNDFLTGLYNRMRCERDLQKYIQQAGEGKGQGALLYIDLDDFKHINNGLGHRYGDILLKAISNSLQQVEGIGSSCYRMGGDEFIIIIHPGKYKELGRILEDIREIFSKPWFLKGAEYYCTVSMGLVRFPEDGETVQELIRNADIALHEAKKAGKNRCEFFSSDGGPASIKRLELEKNMRDATLYECDEFEVFYQPVIGVDSPGHPCIGAEALIRWNSQNLGLIGPREFISLAEYLGLINPIGIHVMRRACQSCKRWNDGGRPDYKVNVNLSVVQLLQNDIVEYIEEVLEETQIKPSNLILEVTESLAANDMTRMKEVLGRIKRLGVLVALDDFGTGYSSLNYIREMPIDIIKIDRSFIMDIGKDEFADVFVKVVSELADTMGMKICVEGLETLEQLEALSKTQVAMVQGYYFDKPMPLEQFESKYL